MDNIIDLKKVKEEKAEEAVRESSEIIERNNRILEEELKRDEAGEERQFDPGEYGRLLREMHEANKKTGEKLKRLGYIKE